MQVYKVLSHRRSLGPRLPDAHCNCYGGQMSLCTIIVDNTAAHSGMLGCARPCVFKFVNELNLELDQIRHPLPRVFDALHHETLHLFLGRPLWAR